MLKRIILALLITISIVIMFTGCKKKDNTYIEITKCLTTNLLNTVETSVIQKQKQEFTVNIDSSNANEGKVTVKYTNYTTDNIRIYVLYNFNSCTGYNIKDITKDTVISLTNGIGTYYIEVVKNNGNTETIIATETIEVTSIDEFLPFLHSTYAVCWNEDMEVIKVAKKLTKDIYNSSEKINVIKEFVINSLTYMPNDNKDYSKWTYFPNINDIYLEGKGVCTDFATMFAGICRSQNIPCKLITGYAGTRDTLHVWVEVYNGNRWETIDLTLEDAKATYSSAIVMDPLYYEIVTVD